MNYDVIVIGASSCNPPIERLAKVHLVREVDNILKIKISQDFDYSNISKLSNEIKEKLNLATSVSQISGITSSFTRDCVCAY
jgi:tRNA U34 5-carboxymethylaminomethyl modifying enzyme MnmG/GidA